MKSQKMALLTLLALGSLAVTACDNGKKPEQPSESDSTSESTVIAVESVSLDRTTASMETGDKLTLTASITGANGATPSDTSLLWYSSDENEEMATLRSIGNKCTVSAWAVTPANTPVVITVRSVADPTKSATCAITITKKDTDIHVESVQITSTDVTIENGAASADLEDTYVQLNVTVLGANGAQPTDDTVTWSIPTTEAQLATVSSSGLVKMLKGGTVHVTATSNDNPSKSDTLALTINDNYVPVHEITISLPQGKDASIKVGSEDDSTLALTANVLGADNKTPTFTDVVWSVEQESNYVVVSSNGVVTAVKAKSETEAGTAVVKATSTDPNAASPEVGSITITVLPADIDHSNNPLSVAFANSVPDTIAYGTSIQIAAVITPNNGTGVEFSFNNEHASDATFTASQDNNLLGTLTAGPTFGGYVTITATLKDNSREGETGYVGSVTKRIDIIDPVVHVSAITLEDALFTDVPNFRGDKANNKITLYKGDTLSLANDGYVTVTPDNADSKELSYTSNDEGVATVLDSGANKGKLTAVAAGTTTIRIASKQDPEVYAEFTLQVKDLDINSVTLAESSATLEVGESKQLAATVHLYKDGAEVSTSTKVTWSVKSGDEDYVTVTSAGLVTAKKAGTGHIIAAATDDPTVTKEFTATVVDTRPIVELISNPTSIESYKNSVRAENLTSITNLYSNADADTGDFYEADKAEENVAFTKGETPVYLSSLYKVGNQGHFKFKPRASVRVGSESTYDYNVNFNYELWHLNSSKEFEKVTNLDTFGASINATAGFIDFSGNDAVGEIFKLVVSVADSSNYNSNSEGYDPLEFEFQVVKGYNAYNLADFSFYDNMNSANLDWSLYRSAHELTTPSVASVPDGIIMHSDISMSNDDLEDNENGWASKAIWTPAKVDQYLGATTSPQYADFLSWKNTIGFATIDAAREACNNTLREGGVIFYRNTHAEGENATDGSETFSLEGNFFQLDTSAIKPVVFNSRDMDKEDLLSAFQTGVGSTAALFAVNVKGDDYGNATKAAENEKDVVSYNNFMSNSNGSISGHTTSEVKLAKGGLIGFNTGWIEANYNNVINKSVFTGFQNESRRGEQKSIMNIDRAKAFDMYNGAAYIFGCENNTVTNSWFYQAGGPLFFMDQYNTSDDDDNPVPASVVVDVTNTYLMNLVAGNEPWFESHPMSDTLAGAVIESGQPTGLIGGHASQVYAQAGSARTTTRTMTSAATGTDVAVMNLIAADLYVGGFMADDKVFPQLSGQFNVHNGDENGSMDMSHTAKDGSLNNARTGTESLILTESSKGGIVSASSAFAADPEHNSPDYSIAGLLETQPEVMEQMIEAGATAEQLGQYNVLQYAQSQYMAYYLDVAKYLTIGYDGGCIGMFLGTFDYETYWG